MQARVYGEPRTDGVSGVTAEIVHHEQDRPLRIGAQQMLQEGQEIIGAHPLADQIHPPPSPNIQGA